ncbi:MAG: hypothetical protein JRN57_01495 [Nitrososphaerota archaeon]|nr:hypothetical protein [Nitrososphaerota archaeon]
MSALTRAIQGVILFCTLFGVAFLYEVQPILPSSVFYTVAFGWFLFVVDSALTFVRPRVSYYLGLVLAVLALGATVSQPAHYSLIASGDVTATLTIVIGSVSEVALIVLVLAHLISGRRTDPWSVSAKPEG